MQIAVAEHISVPAEWAPQKAMWTAWPADPDQWSDDLATPRREVAALVRALSPSNRVRLLVAGDEAEAHGSRRAWQRGGDSCRRATATSGCATPGRSLPAANAARWPCDSSTNGWGGKFDLPEDSDRRRRHRQACRHAGAQIRFRARGRRYRAGRRRHAPRDAADSAQRQSQWLDRGPSRSRATGGLRRQTHSLDRPEVS